MNDIPAIEVTGGGYEEREGIRVEHKDGRIIITGWYDGVCGLEVEIDMPADEFLRRLRVEK